MRCFLLLLLILWPAPGSAGSPVPIEIYAEIDHGLRLDKVLADPVSYHGRTLLFGGIVERSVSEPGRVSLEVAGYRLTDDDRPTVPDPTLGRIIVAGAGLDGAKLQPGRLITLVGEVAGRDDAGAEKLPMVIARFVHGWPTAAEEAAAREVELMRGSCYDPWYDPWFCGPYRRGRFGGSYYRHWH